MDDTVLALTDVVRRQQEQIAILRAERDEARRALSEIAEVLGCSTRREPDPPETPAATPKPTAREFRADVAGRQPDPFRLNGTCEVCSQGFHKDGPRQQVCNACRRLDPRVSIEALKALHAQRQRGAETPAADTTLERQACRGPSPDCDEPCPRKKTVMKDPAARGPLRCPDCHLECKRRRVRARLTEKRAEDGALGERIAAASPPRRADDDEFETVWNGGEGLTSGGGSSLHPTGLVGH